MSEPLPRLVVFTTLFPHPGQPGAGLFIRERMFRVGQHLALSVVAPVPWFPFQYLIRRWRPHFRPPAPYLEKQGDFEVYHPRFLSFPGIFKFLDGWLLALCSLRTVARLKLAGKVDIIDSHFAYPDGYAATLIGRWLDLPVTITLRGTEVPISRTRVRRRMMLTALKRAHLVFSVADALKRHVVSLGADPDKICPESRHDRLWNCRLRRLC
jgi:teichuronic acid biosynthesis glycosyltransferase TuaC